MCLDFWKIAEIGDQAGFSSIDVFSKVAEGIEFVSALIKRYMIVERLYLHQDFEPRYRLQEAITKLYAATLTYLAKINDYCAKNTLSMCSTAGISVCIAVLDLGLSVLIRSLRTNRSRSERESY